LNKLKLGSLFDGIGGFPLSAQRHGIEPVWASEIEPFPIKVTQHHFPNMKQLGDITQINGAEIEPVDIITFGSPCQDLSVAGKREGLSGERSGLFSHAVRIIREMRAASSNNYPRFAVWENVPGAFSSNKGQDFRAVLEEITESEIPMPVSGKWANSGMVRTERVDIAWRIINAMHWGVPQRRRRIFLVADFGGQCAAEILFIEQGVSGNLAESRKARQEVAATTGDGVKCTVYNESGPGWISEGVGCLRCEGENRPSRPTHICILEPIPIHDKATRYKGGGPTRKNDGAANGFGVGKPGDVMPTLGTGDRHAVAYPDPAHTLLGKANLSFRDAQDTVVSIDCRNFCENKEISATLQSGGYSLNKINPVYVDYMVRRLTPLECERLMGFPDGWTDIPGASDTARYKALGNSVARPCVDFIMSRIAEVLRTK
jgi:DNA (cytosine-5)-methyltransferase 1